ncbi:MAG: gliding motility protein GldN [bacterium]|nr:gliding motility protein GldN [bacterium]
MKRICYALIFGTLFTLGINVASAQNPAVAPAIKPKVVESQIMFKKTVWRRMDLNERQNKPFFSINGEITKVIIEAARKGLIFPYENDSCLTRMSMDVFEERVAQEADPNANQGNEPDANDPFAQLNQQQNTAPTGPLWIPPSEFNILQLKEELYFDKLRSRMYYDIKSVTIYLSATSFYNQAGFQKPIASFKYEDLEKLFREIVPEKAIWYNNQNLAGNLNMADAFQLRLFSAPIVKISNATDRSIREIYGQGKKGIIAAQQLEYELINFENEMWEF